MKTLVRRALSHAATLVLSVSAAHAGTVHVVSMIGGGDFTEIQPAVDAATDGDIVVVRYPWIALYAPFVIDNKALTVIGDVTAVGDPAAASCRRVEVKNLAAGKTVVLRKLGLNARSGPGEGDLNLGAAAEITSCAGRVRLEECSFFGEQGESIKDIQVPSTSLAYPGLIIEDCADVVFAASALVGGDGASIEDEDFDWFTTAGAPALHAIASLVAAYDTAMNGGDGGDVNDTTDDPAGDGGAAIHSADTTLYLSGCSLQGGAGGSASFDTLFGCAGVAGDGGHGLVLESGVVRELDATFAGGGPGTFHPGPGGGPGAPGQPIVQTGGQVVSLPGVARSIVVDAPLLPGQAGAVTLRGGAGDAALVLVSLATGNSFVAPYLGNLLVGSPAVVMPAGTLAVDGSGSFSFIAPSLGTMTEGIGVYLQIVTQNAAEVRLGSASVLVIVNQM